MAFDIGPKIGIEGEKEFRDTLNQLNTNLKTMGTEMGAVTSAFDKNDKSAEALTAQNEVLNKQIEEQRKKLELLQDGLAASADKYGENDQNTQKWQQTVFNATKDLNNMEAQLRDNNKALDDAEGGLDDAGDAANKAGDQAAGSTGNWEKLGNGLAKVGEIAGKALAAIGAAAAAAGTALIKTSLDAMDYTGNVADAAQRTGMAADEFQRYAYAAKLSGIETETMEKAMIRQQTAFAKARDGSGKMSEAYKRLGIDINAVGSSSEAFDQVIAGLAEMGDETERNAIANEIFGKSYAELAPLLNEGAEGIAAMKNEADALGSVMSNEAVAAGEAMGDNLDKLKTAVTGASNSIGAIFMPMLSDLATEGTSLLGEFSRGVAEAGGDMDKIGTVIGETLSKAVATVVEKLPEIMKMGLDIVGAVGKGITDSLPQIITAALDIVTMLADTLLDNLPLIVDVGLKTIAQLAIGLADALPKLIPAMVDTMLAIVDALLDNLDMLVDAALAIIVGLAKGLIDALPKLMEKGPEIILKLVDALIENLPKIAQAALDIIIELGKGLVTNIPTLLRNIPTIVTSMVEGFKAKISEYQNIGKNIVEGLWEGIQSMAGWIKDKVTGFFDGITDSVKGFLGIASPSKLFAGIGNYMAEGLGVGFVSEMDKVAQKIEDSIPTSFDTNVAARVNTRVMGDAMTALAMASGPAASRPIYQINLMLRNGTVLARELFDPFEDEGDRRG